MGVKDNERRARKERIRNAFSKAITLEQGPFNLKGGGHEPRATLQSSIARMLNDLALPNVCVSYGYSHCYYYPLRLINKAAQLLDIEASEFTSRISLASDGPKPRPATWQAPDGTIHRRIFRTQVAQLLIPETKLTQIYSSLGPCSIPRVVISATSKGFVCDDPRHACANTSFTRFDDVFIDHKKNIITIKNGDDIRGQYRIEAASEADAQFEPVNLSVWWCNKGSSLAEVSRFEEALDCFNRAADLDPKNPLIWEKKAAALRNLSRLEEALESYYRLVAIVPDRLGAWEEIGYCLYDLKRYDEAIEAFGNELERNPRNRECFLEKGIALKRLGRVEEALVCYDECLNLAPDDPTGWKNKAIALLALKRYAEVIVCCDHALSLGPTINQNADVLNDKALALKALKRFSEALTCHDRALALRPTHVLNLQNKAVLLHELGNYDEAIAYDERALQLDPDNPALRENKALHLESRRRIDEGEWSVSTVSRSTLLGEYDVCGMHICPKCFGINGPWRSVRDFTDSETKREYEHKCHCERQHQRDQEERWPRFDFNTCVELCKCCGAELLLSGSKWSVWFCEDCKEMVRQFHGEYQRYIIPIGRHSFHGGFGLDGGKAKDPAEVEYFVQRWNTISEAIQQLDHFARLVVADNLMKLGVERGRCVTLGEYLDGLHQAPVDKKAAFLRLRKFFENDQ